MIPFSGTAIGMSKVTLTTSWRWAAKGLLIACRTLIVVDDVIHGPPPKHQTRRPVASISYHGGRARRQTAVRASGR